MVGYEQKVSHATVSTPAPPVTLQTPQGFGADKAAGFDPHGGVPIGGKLASPPDTTKSKKTIKQEPEPPATMAKSAPGQFLFDGNGHVYEYIAAPGITWEKAHVLAASKRFKDSRGYLANVTSQAELDFLETVVIPGGAHTANIYLGGQQISPGKWVWLRGPENGTVFWNNGSVGAFAPWDTIYALTIWSRVTKCQRLPLPLSQLLAQALFHFVRGRCLELH